jgi:hypothetical protein
LRTWTADIWTTAEPSEVLAQLTDPDAIARWSPVDFETVDLDEERLRTGAHLRVRGVIVGRPVEFAVDVLVCDETCLALLAEGPLRLEVEYLVCPRDCGSEVSAAVTVHGRGMLGRLVAAAAEALLAAGALGDALHRITASAAAATV